ncbi:5-dehydro-4-deoxyglucarate dehydratase [soil metagenome]
MTWDPLELRDRLRGALAFPVTPFLADLSLDERGFSANADRLAASGVVAIVVAGGTGEFHALAPAEILRLCALAVDAVSGRVPVIVGVGLSAATARALAAGCEEAGADGLLMMPAAYGRAEDEGLYAYYAAIATSVRIGTFPYARDHAVLSPALVARLAALPNVVAFKDGHGDLRLWKRIREAVGTDLRWLAGVGDDLAPQYFSAGAEGFTSSIANLDPALAVRLYELASGGDIAGAEELVARRIAPIYALRGRRRGYEVASIKQAMTRVGLPAGPVRPPLVPVADAELPELDRALRRLAEADDGGRRAPSGNERRQPVATGERRSA